VIIQGSAEVAKKPNKSNVIAYRPKKPARNGDKVAPTPAGTGVPRQDDTRVMALDLPPGTLSPAMQAYFQKCQEKLDFAVKITNESWAIEEEDRDVLRRAGFSDRDIWDIAAVAGFFNMSNRVASATDMRPNAVYHGQGR
jgi:hypothetical protein